MKQISERKFAEIIVAMTEALPSSPEESLRNCSRIWAEDNDEILCRDGQTATAIANLIDAVYGEPVTYTGYYDPAEDERNGEVDNRTGYWYIAVQ